MAPILGPRPPFSGNSGGGGGTQPSDGGLTPTIQNAINAKAPVLTYWVGSRDGNPLDLPDPPTRVGTTTGTGWDATNKRWVLTDDRNLRWQNNLIDWDYMSLFLTVGTDGVNAGYFIQFYFGCEKENITGITQMTTGWALTFDHRGDNSWTFWLNTSASDQGTDGCTPLNGAYVYNKDETEGSGAYRRAVVLPSQFDELDTLKFLVNIDKTAVEVYAGKHENNIEGLHLFARYDIPEYNDVALLSTAMTALSQYVSVSNSGQIFADVDGFTNHASNLVGDIQSSSQAIVVASSTPFSTDDHIKIGSEIIRISGISQNTNTLTVNRGQEGTTAVAHQNTEPVYLAEKSDATPPVKVDDEVMYVYHRNGNNWWVIRENPVAHAATASSWVSTTVNKKTGQYFGTNAAEYNQQRENYLYGVEIGNPDLIDSQIGNNAIVVPDIPGELGSYVLERFSTAALTNASGSHGIRWTSTT